jgi:hypothetical protein
LQEARRHGCRIARREVEMKKSCHGSAALAVVVAFALPLAASSGCQRHDLSREGDAPAAGDHGMAAPDAEAPGADEHGGEVARNLTINLTGCLERSGEAFVLTNARGGAASPDRGHDATASTSDAAGMTRPEGTGPAGSNHEMRFELQPSGEQDLSRYVGKRVSVTGYVPADSGSNATDSGAGDHRAVPGTDRRPADERTGTRADGRDRPAGQVERLHVNTVRQLSDRCS